MNLPASQGRLPGEASVMEKLERVSKASGLWPQRPEPSLGVRSQSFAWQVQILGPHPWTLSPSGAWSWNQGSQPPSCSRLGLQQQPTDEDKGPERAGGWPGVTQHRSHMTLTDPHSPQISASCTLTSEMKEGRSASWCKPLGCFDNPERPSAAPGEVLNSIGRRSSTTSQGDFQVSHVISLPVCFFVRKWGQK